MGIFKDCGCGCNGKKQEQKLLISIMSALVFFVVANPDTFRLMRRILGSWISGPNGCPTTAGLVVHTIVFMLIVWGMMNIKKSESYATYEPTEVALPREPATATEDSAPPMVFAPSPLPGITEKTYDMTDTGAMFAPMDINEDLDRPALIKSDGSVGATTCACSDGRKVVITP